MPPTTRSRAARMSASGSHDKSLETIPETSNARSKSKSKPSNHSPDVVDVMNKVEKLNLSSKPSADTTNVDQLETQLSGMTIRSPREQGAGMPKSNSKSDTTNKSRKSTDSDILFDMASMKDELASISSATVRKPETSRTKKDSISSIHTQRVPLPYLSSDERASKLNMLTAESLHLEDKCQSNPKGVKAALLLCKCIQCLLWDADFRYTLLNYQYDAVLAAAGINVKGLLNELVKLDEKDQLLLVNQTMEGWNARRKLCEDSIDFAPTKGLLLADAMGLGKTIVAIGATILRLYVDRIHRTNMTFKPMPTLILAPSDAFLNQWESTLFTSGVPESQITRFTRDVLPEQEGFTLITRHDLMIEMRHLFKGEGSVLFLGLTVPEAILKSLNEKKNSSGKVDELTQVISSYAQMNNGHNFLSFIIDEGHSLRNLSTYGAIGAALLGVISKRTIAISATPFIDSTQDVATLMAFIDPTMEAAYKSWWKKATKTNADDAVVQDVSNLRKNYIIRRERDVLKNELTRKSISIINVDCHESELEVYKRYEDLFLKAAQNADPDLTVGKKELATVLLSYLINMRMSLIHPLIPKGREFTVRFSPSRRHMESKLTEKLCVGCSGDASYDPLISLPASICQASNSATPHFVHESCMKILQGENGGQCPRCKDFKSRAGMDCDEANRYCKGVNVAPGINGFQPTAKIRKVVEWVKSLPKKDKAIIYSFFEGSLDLLEGVFSELGIDCARLDNDFGPELQAVDLIRFKTTPSCKILLATVQSCGSGLNIEEANHVAFLDRWFDGSIHEQAQDRCHNLNQNKDVEVVYFDTSITVDNVMKAINDAMSVDATITLADGTAIGTQQRPVRFKEISGPISKMVEAVVKERAQFTAQNPGAKLSSCRNFLGRLTYSAEVKGKKDRQSMQSPLNSPSSSEVKTPSGSGAGTCPRSSDGRRQRRVVFAPLPNGYDASGQAIPGVTPIRGQGLTQAQVHTPVPRPFFQRQNAHPFDPHDPYFLSPHHPRATPNNNNYYPSPQQYQAPASLPYNFNQYQFATVAAVSPHYALDRYARNPATLAQQMQHQSFQSPTASVPRNGYSNVFSPYAGQQQQQNHQSSPMQSPYDNRNNALYPAGYNGNHQFNNNNNSSYRNNGQGM